MQMKHTHLSPRCNCTSQVYGIHSWKLGKGLGNLLPLRSALPGSCQRGFSPDPEKTQHFLNRHHPAKVRRTAGEAHFSHKAKCNSQGYMDQIQA